MLETRTVRQRQDHEEALCPSGPMRKVYSLVDRVAATDLDVLITGEAGVGKEVIARRIHRLSKRTRKAFVKVETGRLESSFWAGRLLGLRPFVAWTAMAGRDGGTIYFDEVAELHPVAQASMLQLILDRDSRRTDSGGSARPEARILASTRRDLWREVTAGNFREDLFLRLHAVEIAVPPLRERPEDIPTLVLAFVEEFREALASETAVAFEPSDFEALAECGWPGNVRELREFVRQVVRDGIAPAQAIAERRAGSGEDCKGADKPALSLAEAARLTSEAVERRLILKALEESGGDPELASRRLNISHRVLLGKIRNLQIVY